MSTRTLVCLTLLAGVTQARPSRADDAPPDLQQLTGAKIDIKQLTKTIGAAEVVKVTNGTSPGTIRALMIKAGEPPRQQQIGCSAIVEIFWDGKPLDVTFDKRANELRHDPEKRKARLAHDAKVEEQLRAKRGKFWEEISAEDQEKFVAAQKEFLQQAQQTMGIPMQLLETKYYLFFTDMPLNTVGIYVQYLDQMYVNMTKAFDFPEGKNIWRGKCPVVAFANQADYVRFERDVMKYDGAQGSQGLCHTKSNGDVVMACFKGGSEGFFAVVLVHETSHGFIHRYKSTVHVPLWMNEGIADWVAQTVVGKLDDEVQDRQRDAVARIRAMGTLGGRFYADDADYESWQYGVASSMVEILLRTDSKKYRLLIDGVKEGLDSEEALRQAYGIGFAELTKRYGQLAGVPNLQP